MSTAPFDGIITLRKSRSRRVDLLKEASLQASSSIKWQKIDNLRIYVNAPQRVARYFAPRSRGSGSTFPEFPERKFVGKVSNVSGGAGPQHPHQAKLKFAFPTRKHLIAAWKCTPK